MNRAKLFYVIGASGSGKDSIIDYAKKNLQPEKPVVFARRYITRPRDSGGENHIEITRDEFKVKKEKGSFTLCWQSHGLSYGIDTSIKTSLKKGLSVVMNGSRAHLNQAAAQYPELHPVLIVVSPEVLLVRLNSRGRESSEQIEKRMARSELLKTISHPELSVINNDGHLHQAGALFLSVIQG